MAKRMRLTDERVRQFAFPADKKHRQAFLRDAEMKRLAVRQTPTGQKSFIFETKLDGRSIRMTIGDCAVWTLQAARTEARRLQTMVDKGIDPRALVRQRRAEKQALKKEAEAKKQYTLEALLDAYVKHLESQGKTKTAGGLRSLVKKHVVGADATLAGKPAVDVTPHDVAALIRQAREKGKERTAGMLRSMFNAAYNCGRRAAFDSDLPAHFIKFEITHNPVSPIPTIPTRAGNRTLTRDELKGYILALTDTTVDMALKLALYAGGQRMAQLLRAEVTDWNPNTQTLRLFDAKGRRQTPREHLLPLAPEAAAIVSRMVERSQQAGVKFLFPSAVGTRLHEGQPGPRITQIARQIGAESFNLQDIRRTCETELAGLGVSRDIRAQLLSHGLSGVQTRHYDRHDYLREKHAALLQWERFLAGLVSGEPQGKIIPFTGGVR